MASNEDLAKLVVRLEAQTAKYDEALKNSRKQLKQLKDQVDVVANASRLASQVIGAAFSAQVLQAAKATVDWADGLNDLSTRTGISTEALSQLSYAAKLSGTDLDAVRLGVETLARTTISGENADSLKALGVSARNADGSLKDTPTLVYEIADAFAEFKSGPAKTAAAMDLFGKSGAALIPLLNGGSKALKEFAAESDAVGYTLDSNTAASAAQLNDTIDRLTLTSQAWAQQVMQQALPAATDFADYLLGVSKNTDGVQNSVTGAVAAIKAFVSAGYIVSGVLKTVGQYLGAVGAIWTQVFSGDFAGAADTASMALDDLENIGTETADQVAKVWEDSAKRVEDATAQADAGMQRTLLFNPAAAKAAAAAAASVDKAISALQEQYDLLGANDEQAQLYKLAVDGASEAQLQLAQNILANIASYKANQQAAEAYAAQQEELNQLATQYGALIAGITDAQYAFNQQFSDANKLLDAGKISWEQYNAIVDNAQRSLDDASKKTDNWGLSIEEIGKQAARNTQDALAEYLFDPFNASLGELDKNFAQTLQRMAAQAAAAAILKSLLGSLSGLQSSDNGLLSMIGTGAAAAFGGAHADGSDITRGWNLVGEQGPELVYSGGRANVYDAKDTQAMLSGGQRVVNQTFNVTTPDADSFRASQRQILRRARQGVFS